MLITEEIANKIVDFIKHRPTVPFDAENVIVKKQKENIVKQIKNKILFDDNDLIKLTEIIKHRFYNSLIHPGESVGIICGQCIGERTTQSSLNNFHSAGLDTGSTSTIEAIQSIINVSKAKKTEVRKYFNTSLYFVSKPKSVIELNNLIAGYLEEKPFKYFVVNMEKDVQIPQETFDKIFMIGSLENLHLLKIFLNLEKLYMHRVTRQQIVYFVNNVCDNFYILPYSMLDKSANSVELILGYQTIDEMFSYIRQLREAALSGILGVNSCFYAKDAETNEWYVECLCNSIHLFLRSSTLFDTSRIQCDSINDFYNVYGILAAQELIIFNLKKLMPDMARCHFEILANRITKSGNLEPLTRHSMRNTTSPLSKASFEESFETFLKAGKYKEIEKFNSVSSSIICGKKPKIGTYQSDILMNPEFFFNE